VSDFQPPEADDRKPRVSVPACLGCGRQVAGHPGEVVCLTKALRRERVLRATAERQLEDIRSIGTRDLAHSSRVVAAEVARRRGGA
jgi:hypothetical protein